MSGHYARLYQRAREALEAEAEAILLRPLTAHERNLFRSCGTLTRLEELGMIVYYTESAEELAHSLAATSMASRFLLALKEIIAPLETLLGRTLNAAEQEQIKALGNTEELWALEEQLNTALPTERAALFQAILNRRATAERS